MKAALEWREYRLLSLLSPFLALGIWEAVVRVFDLPSLVAPPPSVVAAKLVNQLVNGLLLNHLKVTATEIVGGFLFGSFLGIATAVLVSQSRLAEAFLYPIVLAVKSVPKIALAPVIVLWLGYGYESKITVAALSAFFPLFVNVASGLWRTDADQLRLMRSLTASPWQTFRTIKIPGALPAVFTGLEIAIVLSIVGAVVGEFISAREGLGYYIMISETRLDTAGIFVSLTVLAALGITLSQLVKAVGRKVVFWVDVGTSTNW